MNYIVLAIPVFFVLIALELVITRVTERDYYSLGDSINDLSTGIIQQVLEIFVKTALFAGYLWVYETRRLTTLSDTSAFVWVACFLGIDVLYYWFHRMSHEVNAFWAAHVVHHQSEEYNLAVALRQGAFQGAFSWVFYLPLALLGFPPLVFLTLSSVNTLYQFWIHTRVIGKMGPLEWALNTPSHHRVHHGRNPKYIDKNHGAVFIVWDRLFGTFKEEEEEPAYGITTPLASWNPVWANLHYWVELWGKARRTARWSDKIRMFLKPPGWHPEDLGGFMAAPEVDAATARKFAVPLPAGLQAYTLLGFLVVLAVGSVFMFRYDTFAPLTRVALAAAVLTSLVILGGLLEGKRWAFTAESARLAVLAAAAVSLAVMAPRWSLLGVAVIATCAALQAWVARYRNRASPQATAVAPRAA